MKFLKRLILLVLVLVAALVGIGYVLPDSAHVERTARVDAPPEAVFPYVNNLKRFTEWSPWAAKDPDMTQTFQGPEAGIGAQLYWESDVPEVGSGSTLIVESNPPKRVVNRLELPDLSNATYYFEIDEIDETDDGSRVTWGFDTEFRGNLIGRYFGLMMDRWIGAEYERGLENLKQLVEQQSGKQDEQQDEPREES